MRDHPTRCSPVAQGKPSFGSNIATMRTIVPKITYANVAATLALFVALGGSAAAAGGLFTGAQIENGSIHGVDLANHTIGTRKLRYRSVTLRNLSRPTVRRLKGARGRQ